MVTCACGCDRPGRLVRGLTPACYQRERRAGRIADWERAKYTSAELLDEWARLASDGHTRAQAAERLGISKKRLEKAIERAHGAVSNAWKIEVTC